MDIQNNFQSNPNQRYLTIRTPSFKGANNYIQIFRDDLEQAVQNLTPTEVIIYLDICGNADGFHLAFCPAYFYNTYGIAKTTAQKAFKRFQDLGYITSEGGKYYFNRQPQPQQPKKDDYSSVGF